MLIVAPCTTRPFQSTPSVGRATLFQGSGLSQERRFQSTPSVGRATSIPLHYRFLLTISIHALRGEGDKGTVPARIEIYSFQSTPSVGRATAKIYKYAMLCLYIVHIKLYIFATAVLFT